MKIPCIPSLNKLLLVSCIPEKNSKFTSKEQVK